MEKLMAIVLGFFGAAAASFSAVLFMVWFCFIIVSVVVGIALLVLWVIALIDCIKRDNKDFAVGGDNAKLMWILLLVLVRSITPVIYYLLIIYKKPKTKIPVKKK